MIRSLLILASSILTIWATVPYLLDIVKGKTKPRIVTWFTWSLLSSITSAAAFSDHQYASAILTLCGAVSTFAVVVLGWKHGDRTFERVDIICQIGALAGLLLWLLFGSPALAVIITTVIDLIGTIPTQLHAWKAPNEETASTFAYDLIASVCTIAASTSWHLTALLPPVYFFMSNGSILAIILFRRKILTASKQQVA